MKIYGITRGTSDRESPFSSRRVTSASQGRSRSELTDRYEALDASVVREALSAAEQRGNRLFFCAMAWELGHDLIHQQEYELAAECFDRLSGFAASAADCFVLEAARLTERISTMLRKGRPVGPGSREALEVLRRDLSQLTYEELGIAAAALASPEHEEAQHEGGAPQITITYESARTGALREAPTLSDEVRFVDQREKHQQKARLRSSSTLLEIGVHFFFPFELLHHGRSLPLGHNSKAQTILRYLLAHTCRPISQDYLEGWLWPGSSPKRARWSLNSAMCALRKLLAEALPARPAESHVLFEAGYYRLSPCVRIASDVQEFDSSYRNGCYLEGVGQASDAAIEYERAIELYRGDYLVEDLYQDWTTIERERLAGAYMDMLDRLAQHYLENGQVHAALRACYRALEKDSCRENSHGLLMRCHAHLGFQDRALQQYRLCEEGLRTKYDAFPSPRLQALRERLLRGKEI